MIYLGIATFITVIFIAVVLIRRRGRSAETADVLKAIESMRRQNSTEHAAFQSVARSQTTMLSRLLTRFGFLK